MGLALSPFHNGFLGHPDPRMAGRTNVGARGKLIRKLRAEGGQTATEYMMVISVVVIGVVAAAYVFVPSFQTGVFDLSNDVSNILADHGSVKGGFGLAANNASGGGYDPTAAQQGVANSAVQQGGGSYDPNANAGE